jgi:hypothetical protein
MQAMFSDPIYSGLPDWTPTAERASALIPLATTGLAGAYLPATAEFAQTLRLQLPDGPVQREGTNLRYAAIAALGLSRAGAARSDLVLRGKPLDTFIRTIVDRAENGAESGAVALAAWTTAEVLGEPSRSLLDRMRELLTTGRPIPIVDTAWTLTAAVASDDAELAALARDVLLGAQGGEGIFPHAIPAASLGRWRAHVGCFADQVYPIQALARFAAKYNDAEALAASDRTAARICELQGSAGQWWWHYDARDGTVVEQYPVYSVHQHGMAPMALFDLAAAGGVDHHDAIDLGFRWLTTRPETTEPLISPRHSLIWRKVGRREPPKVVRKVSAVTTSLRPGWRLPARDTLFPPGPIDHECRPYELGWLLYAWGSERSAKETP